jgi:hypothetical protein
MSFFQTIARSVFKAADRLTDSWSTLTLVNHFLKGYGTMTEIKIDAANKSIAAEVMLLGESTPIVVNVGSYRLTPLPDGTATMVVEGVTVSRPWMQKVAEQVVVGKVMVVPKEVAGWLGIVL